MAKRWLRRWGLVFQHIIGELSELFKGSAWSDKKERNLAILMAHVGMGYKLQEIADNLNMHYASISRIVVQVEKEMLQYKDLTLLQSLSSQSCMIAGPFL